MVEFCLTCSCPFLGVLTRVLVGFPPSPGCDCTGLVASGSSELEAALPVRSVHLLRRSLALVQADDSLPLVSSLSAEHFGLWPYGLAIAALPLFCALDWSDGVTLRVGCVVSHTRS